jgi:hypothetical protein
MSQSLNSFGWKSLYHISCVQEYIKPSCDLPFICLIRFNPSCIIWMSFGEHDVVCGWFLSVWQSKWKEWVTWLQSLNQDRIVFVLLCQQMWQLRHSSNLSHRGKTRAVQPIKYSREFCFDFLLECSEVLTTTFTHPPVSFRGTVCVCQGLWTSQSKILIPKFCLHV